MLAPSGSDSVLSSRKCNSISDDDSGCALDEYTWVPPGLSPHQVYQYMCSLPKRKTPCLSSTGEKHRIRQLLRQLPPQDSKASYCIGLSDEEKNEFHLFQSCRKRNALGRGTICPLPESAQNKLCEQCHDNLIPRELVVFASRAGPHVSWHPTCFVCCVCREILVDLLYFYKEGKIYCGRHHAESLKPRCVTCDEIIFAEECTEAEGSSWHMKHFYCYECNCLLGGQEYIMRNGRPYCCPCFELLFADCCESCGQVISVEDGRMTHTGHQWHATDLCFSCRNCRQSLINKSFLLRQSELYCSPTCLTGKTGFPDLQGRVIDCSSTTESNRTEIFKNIAEDNLPEDYISWTSLSNRDDHSSIYSEINYKWKNTSQSSEDPTLQDIHNLTETDSGLNLTFTTPVGWIPERDTNLITSNNSSTGCIVASSLINDIRLAERTRLPCSRNNSAVDSGGIKGSSRLKEMPEKNSPIICPTNYMIDPEKYYLNSPTSESFADCPWSSPTANRTSPMPKSNCGETENVVFPLSYAPPYSSSLQTAGRLSPVNEISTADAKADCKSSHSPKTSRTVECLEQSPTEVRPNANISLQKLPCKYCNSIHCKCPTKASLPDLSYTTVYSEKNWRQNPFRLLKRNCSSNNPNTNLHKTTSVGGHHRPSGYASDSALKRRRTRQPHATESSGTSNQRQPKLGIGFKPASVCTPGELNSTCSLHSRFLGTPTVNRRGLSSEQVADRLAALQLEWDACSTCSSSSSSEFDYYLNQSSTPSSHPIAPSSKRLKKRKHKQCLIS